jgi:hypothetical protein
MELTFYLKRFWAGVKRFQLVWLFIGYALSGFFYLRFRLDSFWSLLLVVGLTFGFSWLTLRNLERSVFLSFLISQVAWVLLFLPLGYVSMAGVLLVFYLFLVEVLSGKGRFRSAGFLFFALFLILLTSRWGL